MIQSASKVLRSRIEQTVPLMYYRPHVALGQAGCGTAVCGADLRHDTLRKLRPNVRRIPDSQVLDYPVKRSAALTLARGTPAPAPDRPARPNRVRDRAR